MKSANIQINPARDDYAAIAWPKVEPNTTSRHAKHLTALITWIRSQSEFHESTNRRRDNWSAVNVDPYSISTKYEAVLYQYRQSNGSKYGKQVRKSYYLATWGKDAKNHVTETEINASKARSAVRLFEADPAGAVEYLLGLRAKPAARPQPPIKGFKLVRVRLSQDGHEHYFSYFDGRTEYVLGQATRQTARSSHSGGYYCYLSQELCEPANIAVSTSVRIEPGEGLAVLEIEGTGKRIRYDDAGKYAVSTLTPVRVVRTITQPTPAEYEYDYEE